VTDGQEAPGKHTGVLTRYRKETAVSVTCYTYIFAILVRRLINITDSFCLKTVTKMTGNLSTRLEKPASQAAISTIYMST
jgi:hypothetical protein